MARFFVRASSQKLDLTSAIVTTVPFTIAAWYKQGATGADYAIAGIAKDTVDTDYVELLIGGGANKIGARANSATEGNGTALSSVAATSGVWQHAAAVFTSASSRAAYLNGGSKGTNATTINPAGLNHTSVGRVPSLTPADHFDGDLAYVGMWSIALTDADVLSLSQGVSPLQIRPDALVFYAPCLGSGTTEPDVIGRKDLTVTGATQSTSDAPIIRPRSARILAFSRGTTYTKALTANGVPQAVSVTLLPSIHYAKTITANGVPQTVTLTRYKPVTYLQTRTANGVPQTVFTTRTVVPFDGTVGLVSVAGTTRSTDVLLDSLRIEDLLNDQPNLCYFNTKVGASFTPTVGMDVKVGLGNLVAKNLVFGGTITKADQIYRGLQANVGYQITCQDYTYLLDRRVPIVRYTATSATSIVTGLIAAYATGFTTTNVTASLASISIDFDGTQTLSQCLTAVANAIGGYWYVGYDKDIHFFLTEATLAPDTINAANILSGNGARDLLSGVEIAQIRTRILVTGKGTTARLNGAAVAAATLRLPVSDASFFDASGGSAKLAAEILSYSGRFTALDGNGKTTASKVVGPLQSPGTLSPTLVSSGGHITGTVAYKTTFVLGDRGESEPSSGSSSVAGTQVSVPGNALGFTYIAGGNMTTGNYGYRVTYVTATGETEAANDFTATMTGGTNSVGVNSIPTSGDSRVIGRNIYRSVLNDTTVGHPRFLCKSLADNTTTAFTDTIADLSLGQALSNVNTTGDSATLASIPTGPSGTTSRKLYRTKAGGSTYCLLGTIADNATTAWTDTKDDADLGNEAPQFSNVSTLAGATSLRIRDTAQVTTAGWVDIGGQLVSYTARSVSSGEGDLTGVPATGVGAIATDINGGNIVTAVPHLITSGPIYAVNDNDPLSLYVVRNDATAQTVLAALEGGDGIHEFPVSDTSLTTIAQCNARGDAELTLFKSPINGLAYTTRDPLTRAGKQITVSLAAPTSISLTVQIQSVTIDQFGIPGQYPLFHVKAAPTKFTMQDLLRKVAA